MPPDEPTQAARCNAITSSYGRVNMNNAFQWWRRWAGNVTLVVACVLTCLWVRSRDFEDEFVVVISRRHLCLASQAGWFSCWLWTELTESNSRENILNWHSQPTFEHVTSRRRESGEENELIERIKIVSYIDMSYRRRAENWPEFHKLLGGGDYDFQIAKLELPCVWVVTPLVALSAFLLLGKLKAKQFATTR